MGGFTSYHKYSMQDTSEMYRLLIKICITKRSWVEWAVINNPLLLAKFPLENRVNLHNHLVRAFIISST